MIFSETSLIRIRNTFNSGLRTHFLRFRFNNIPGAIMRYLMALFFLIVTMVFAVTDVFTRMGFLALFWNAPSLIIVLLPAAVFVVSTTHWATVKNCFRALGSSSSQLTRQEAKEVDILLKLFGNMSLLLGILATFMGFVLIGADLSQIEALGPNLSIAILTIVYGMVIKIACYSAEKRLEFVNQE